MPVLPDPFGTATPGTAKLADPFAASAPAADRILPDPFAASRQDTPTQLAPVEVSSIRGDPLVIQDWGKIKPSQARERLKIWEETMSPRPSSFDREGLRQQNFILNRLRDIAKEDDPSGAIAEPSAWGDLPQLLIGFAPQSAVVAAGTALKPLARGAQRLAETKPVTSFLDVLKPYGKAVGKMGEAIAETPIAQSLSRNTGAVWDAILQKTAPAMRSEAAKESTYPIRHFSAEERRQQLIAETLLRHQEADAEAKLAEQVAQWQAEYERRGYKPRTWRTTPRGTPPTGAEPPPLASQPFHGTEGLHFTGPLPYPEIPPAEHASWYEYATTQGYQPNRWELRQRDMLRERIREAEMFLGPESLSGETGRLNDLRRALAQREKYLAESAYWYMMENRPLDPRLRQYIPERSRPLATEHRPPDDLDPFVSPDWLRPPPLSSAKAAEQPFWLSRQEAEDALELAQQHGFTTSPGLQAREAAHNAEMAQHWEQAEYTVELGSRGTQRRPAPKRTISGEQLREAGDVGPDMGKLLEQEETLLREKGQEALTWLLQEQPGSVPRGLTERHPYGRSLLGDSLPAHQPGSRGVPYPSPTNAQRHFYDSMEHGLGKYSPELEGQLQRALEQRYAELRQLPPEALEDYLQNAFPTLFHDVDRTRRLLEEVREHADIPDRYLTDRLMTSKVEAINNGLFPRNSNPVSHVLGELSVLDHFLMKQRALAAQQELGLIRFINATDTAPAGWKKLPEDVAQSLLYRKGYRRSYPGTHTLTDLGAYWAPEDVALIWKNWASEGLRGDAIYDSARTLSNAMVQARLSLSGFHAVAESFYAMTSDLSVGMMQMSEGRVAQGAQSMGRGLAPVNPLRMGQGVSQMLQGQIGQGAGEVGKGMVPPAVMSAFEKGRVLLQEAANPGSTTPAMAEMIKILTMGGMDFQRNHAYSNTARSAAGDMWRNMRGNPILRGLEKLSAPIMQKFVPAVKLGAASRLAEEALARLPANATEQQIRAAMARVVNSIDNRFGLLAYDNLFWHRTLKDVSHVALTSVGWNMGSVREGGGAVVDTAQQMAKVLRGEAPELTERMSFVMALPFLTGIYGGMMHYLMTGERPQELRDYYYPKTGRKQGKYEERLKLPTYVHDATQILHGLVQKESIAGVVGGKLNPLVNDMWDFWNNQDFFGLPIRGEKGDKVPAMMDVEPLRSVYQAVMYHVTNSYVPFSLSSAYRAYQHEDWPALVGGITGFTKAPNWMQESPEQERYRQWRERQMIDRKRQGLERAR